MFRIVQFRARQDPELRVVPGLPAYETRAMAEKVCQLRFRKEKIFFWASPWLVTEVKK